MDQGLEEPDPWQKTCDQVDEVLLKYLSQNVDLIQVVDASGLLYLDRKVVHTQRT